MWRTQRLQAAYSAVAANHGCAGVDGVTIGQFERRLDFHIAKLQDELDRGVYFPLPLMQVLVAKKNGQPRKLCIPTVRDRVAERAVLDRIEPILEKEFEECSYAYRKGRSVKQVVYKIIQYYNDGFRWVVNVDVDAFFDTVDHDLLLEKFNRFIHDDRIRKLVAQWVKAEVWDGRHLEVLSKGIPQGSAISPVLANLFLDELDEAMLAQGYRYLRYADDYVILCKERSQAFQALKLSKKVLADLLLELDDEEVTSFERGFKYLGVVFLNSMVMKPFETQMKHRKVLYYPAPFNLQAYMLKRHLEATAG